MFSILVLFAGLLYPTGTVANELESNPDIKTVIDYVNLERNIISPNGDGKFDEDIFKMGLKKKVSLNAEVWDAMNPTGGHYRDGTIGFILRLGYQGPGQYDFKTNGGYIRWEYPNPNLIYLMHYSVYSL